MMISRFTEKAQAALQRAQQIMFAKQHTQLDLEHIFLALLQQRGSLIAEIITRLGGDVQKMESTLDRGLRNIPGFASSRGTTTGYITLRANRVLQGAAEEADRLNDEYISTEHLFLGVVNEQGGLTGRLMMEAGIDRDKVLAVLPDLRNDPAYAEGSDQPSGGYPVRSG